VIPRPSPERTAVPGPPRAHRRSCRHSLNRPDPTLLPKPHARRNPPLLGVAAPASAGRALLSGARGHSGPSRPAARAAYQTRPARRVASGDLGWAVCLGGLRGEMSAVFIDLTHPARCFMTFGACFKRQPDFDPQLEIVMPPFRVLWISENRLSRHQRIVSRLQVRDMDPGPRPARLAGLHAPRRHSQARCKPFWNIGRSRLVDACGMMPPLRRTLSGTHSFDSHRNITKLHPTRLCTSLSVLRKSLRSYCFRSKL